MKRFLLPYVVVGTGAALAYLFWGADQIYFNTIFKWPIFQFPGKLYGSLLIAGSLSLYGYVKSLEHSDVLEDSASKTEALSHEPSDDYVSDTPQGLTVGKIGNQYAYLPFLPSPFHQLILGPPGTGKSSTLLNAIIWNFNYASAEERLTSMLVIDPKGEFWELGVINGRDYAVRLDPTTMDSYGFDLYHGLSPESTDDELYLFFNDIACTIIPEGDAKNHTFWGGARIILTGFLEYGYLQGLTFGETIEEIRSVPTTDLVAEMTDPENEILKTHRKIRSEVAEYEKNNAEVIQDISINLKEYLGIFDLETVKHFFSSKNPLNVSALDLINGTSMFLTIPGNQMETFGPVCRLVLNRCLGVCLDPLKFEQKGKRRIWFLVDEAGTIGKIPMLPTAMAQSRSNGIQVTIALQALSDLAQTYGENCTKSMRGYCDTKIIFGTDDDDYIRSITSKTGYYTESKTSTTSRGGALTGEASTNQSSEYRSAVDASDIYRLNRRDEVLVLLKGDWFIAKRCRYFEIPEFREKSAEISRQNKNFHYHFDDESDDASSSEDA